MYKTLSIKRRLYDFMEHIFFVGEKYKIYFCWIHKLSRARYILLSLVTTPLKGTVQY